MRNTATSLSAFIFLTSIPSSFAFAQEALAVPEYELSVIEQNIADAVVRGNEYDGGLIENLINSQIETLTLTKLIIETVQTAEDNNLAFDFTFELAQPDLVRADQILDAMKLQESVILEAEKDADKTGGLVHALAISRVETERLTLAQLRMGYLQALYGLPIHSVATGETSHTPTVVSNKSNEEAIETDGEKTIAEWADPNYPEIDYSQQKFAAFFGAGSNILGNWAVEIDKAAIDDSKTVTAINLTEWPNTSYGDNVALIMRCSEGSTALIYSVDTYLQNSYNSNTLNVTYRIDGNPAVDTRWNETTTNRSTGLFGAKAETFIPKLYDAKTLFLRVKESNGSSHDATFDLAGIRPAMDEVAEACGFSTLSLNKEDYKAIQSLLNANGFNAGTPDGIWGTGSKNALMEFQRSIGISQTGAVNRETLQAIGLQ